jgi:hypothetical protein
MDDGGKELVRMSCPYKMFINELGQVVIRQPEHHWKAESEDEDMWITLDPSQINTFISDLESISPDRGK